MRGHVQVELLFADLGRVGVLHLVPPASVGARSHVE